MIDIHTHILPGVDDGSYSMEESIRMLRIAAEGGVKFLGITPHCNIPGSDGNYWDVKLKDAFESLQTEVKRHNIPVELVLGMEVFATGDLPRLLQEKKILTLNGMGYVLVEFAVDEKMWFCDNILEECVNQGYRPVIAHPERYYFVQKYPELVYFWRKKGYGIQVNKGCIQGKMGNEAKKTVDMLLKHRLVSCVASDAHFSTHRTPYMRKIRDYLMKHYGGEYTETLLWENPRRIFSGEPLTEREIIPFS